MNRAGTELSQAHGALVEQFRQHLVDNHSAPSTVSTYTSYAAAVLEYAEKTNTPLQELPSDLPERVYRALGYKEKNPRRNAGNAALRAFAGWAQTTGVYLPVLTYPPTITPPRGGRRPLRVPQEEIHMADREVPVVATTSGANGATVAEPPVPPAEPPAPPAVPAGAPALAPTSAASAPLEAQPAAASSTTSPEPALRLVQSEPPPTTPPPPATRPSIQRSRAPGTYVPAVARDPVRALLPEGGTLRVERRSDGSDGMDPGSLLHIGDYGQNDLAGYLDIKPFIQQQIHSRFPALRSPVTTYVCQPYDVQGRAAPPRAMIMLQSTMGAAGPGSFDTHATAALLARQYETDSRKQEEEHAADYAKAKKEGASEQVLFLMQQQFQQAQRTERTAAKAEMQALIERAGRQHEGPPPGGYPPGTYPPPPAGWSRSPGTLGSLDGPPATTAGEIASVLRPFTDMVTPVMSAVVSSKLAPPQRDPLLELLLKHMLEPSANPMIAELKTQITRLEDKLARASDSKPPTAAWQEAMANIAALDNLIDKRLERFGGGPTSPVEVLDKVIEKLPEILDSFGRLKAGQVAAPKLGAGTEGRKQERALPPQAEQAIRDIYAAKPDEEQRILNSVFAFVTGLAQNPHFQPLTKQVLAHLRDDVETPEDVRALVLSIFRQVGAREMMKSQPKFVEKTANVLVKHWAAVYGALFPKAPVKPLAGIEEAAEPEDAGGLEDAEEEDGEDVEEEEEKVAVAEKDGKDVEQGEVAP